MYTKWFLILAIVLGFIALLAIGPGDIQQEVVTEDPSQLVDRGRLVLEKDGARLLDESYTLLFHPVDGYMLISQSELVVGDQVVQLAQQTQYDRDFLPIQYQLAAETASGAQIVSAQLGITGLEMEVRAGLMTQNAKVTDVSNLALLDNNLISHYAVMLMAIRTEMLDREFTAAVPQALLSLPGKMEGPNSVEFISGDQVYEGKQFDLRVGDTRIVMLEYDGRLVGLINRTQGTIAYDVDLLPDGLQLPEEEAVEPQAPVLGTEASITFESDALLLSGTLLLPGDETAAVPTAVFLHGSGPVDRDGNAVDLASGTIIMEMDMYRQLAVALAQVGIGSLRYDKRGVGESQGVNSLASRTDLIEDAVAAVEATRAHAGVDADHVILIGHSEGAYLATEIAAADPRIAGVVLLSGAARSLAEVTRWQVATMLQMQGFEDEVLNSALAQQDSYIEFVKTSEGEWSDYSVEQLTGMLPWLTEEAALRLMATPLSLTWLREHYRDDPSVALAGIDVPVLIVSGEKDLQVPASEAALIEQLLVEAGNEDVTVVVLPDLNHLLRYHPEEPNLNYRHLEEPVDARVIEAIQNWIEEWFGA